MAKHRRGRPRKVGRPSKASRRAHLKGARRRRWIRKHGKKALKRIKGGKKVAAAKRLLTRLSHIRGRLSKVEKKKVAHARGVLRKAHVPMLKHKLAPVFKGRRRK